MKKRSLTAIVLLVMLVSGCLVINSEDTVYDDAISVSQYELASVRLNVLESGDPEGIPLVLIHGTPGSADFFSSYLVDPALQDLHLFAIDRPGWGESQVSGEFDATLASQSAMLGDWLCRIAEDSASGELLILAHSYGATLTPRLIMDHPHCISAALLLAGGADPDLTAPRWYNHVTAVPPVSWLASITGLGLKRSNDEMMQVRSGLEAMRPKWRSIKLPITVIQGEDDMLVHPDNADFIEEKLAHIPANVIRRIEDGHMVVHSDRPFVIAELRKLLAQL